jgi:phosphatidylethanolamine-binding protein (PEBP) family uncharacterized protein
MRPLARLSAILLLAACFPAGDDLLEPTTGAGGARGGSPGTGGVVATGGAMATGGSSGASGYGGSPPEVGVGSKLSITVDQDPVKSSPTRSCFKVEASNYGGNKSPRIDWTTPPAGTMSLVLMMEDRTNLTPHRIVCNMKPTETGQPADVMNMIPEGAMAGTGHMRTTTAWYGPGSPAPAHSYEISIFALATPTLASGCGPGPTQARAARDYLRANASNKAVVLDWDGQVLWGDVNGGCN